MGRTIPGKPRRSGEHSDEKGNIMSETFFENPLYVYIALGLVEVVLLGIWFERRAPGAARAMIVPPVLAGVVALMAHWVVTDREQIQTASQDIAEAIAFFASSKADKTTGCMITVDGGVPAAFAR